MIQIRKKLPCPPKKIVNEQYNLIIEDIVGALKVDCFFSRADEQNVEM